MLTSRTTVLEVKVDTTEDIVILERELKILLLQTKSAHANMAHNCPYP